MKKQCPIYIATILFLCSCIDDKGNYTYLSATDMYPASIASGIEERYDVKAGDTLIINPQFATPVDDSDYTYRWLLMSSGPADTIGFEKDLHWPVQKGTGIYTIRLRIKNSRNISIFTPVCRLFVVTEFSVGWFITKERSEGTTDIDMVTPEGGFIPNVIEMVNGSSMQGKPINTTFTHFYEMIDTTTNRMVLASAFIIATHSDIGSFRGDDMTPIFGTNEIFIERPLNIDPYDLGYHCNNVVKLSVLINDGGFHWMPSRSVMNTAGTGGRYTERLLGNYKINRHLCKIYDVDYANMTNQGLLLIFDDNTNSFKKITTNFMLSAPSIINFSNATLPEGIPNCDNMDYNLVYMKEYDVNKGLGVMQSKTDGTYYGFRTVNLIPATAYPFDAWVPVPANANVLTAAVRCTNQNNGTIYSSSGNNEVYAYRIGGRGDASGTESRILTFAPDEQVTHIEDVEFPALLLNQLTTGIFRHLVVLTSQGDNWNMYCYNFIGSSDEIDTTPVQSYTGKGRAVHAVYRDPNYTVTPYF